MVLKSENNGGNNEVENGAEMSELDKMLPGGEEEVIKKIDFIFRTH